MHTWKGTFEQDGNALALLLIDSGALLGGQLDALLLVNDAARLLGNLVALLDVDAGLLRDINAGLSGLIVADRLHARIGVGLRLAVVVPFFWILAFCWLIFTWSWRSSAESFRGASLSLTEFCRQNGRCMWAELSACGSNSLIL